MHDKTKNKNKKTVVLSVVYNIKYYFVSTPVQLVTLINREINQKILFIH